jgi:hypothetical protein
MMARRRRMPAYKVSKQVRPRLEKQAMSIGALALRLAAIAILFAQHF